ncbi:glycosyltransferase family 2 protein [Carnobacterium maltaromaticum]|uniref:glycosyltransferase family 2 protein n=1 Tax=Carnobacterium maltaromaticum TaxID=2751 RepID=UPI00295E3C32|nr:glycosyltransferase family 2 protein [Carnobacterium maltaromaticum]
MILDEKVSVVMPIYNPDYQIVESIRSVLEQSVSGIELFLIDDASTVDYFHYIKEFLKLDNVYFIRLSKNLGPAAARNKGIEKSTGRYVAFIDADDSWEKDKLAYQLASFSEKDIALSFSEYEVIKIDGQTKHVQVPLYITYHGLLKNTIIGCSTVVIDRKKTGPFFMPDIRGGEDTATWLNLLRKGYRAKGIKEILVHYRIKEDSFSRNKWKMLTRTWRMYRKTQYLSRCQTSYYFSYYVVNAIKKRI